MDSRILPLQRTACTAIVRALLDRSDPHSEENRKTGRHLLKQLQSNGYAAISGDVLKMFVESYPSYVSSELVLLLAPPHLRVLDLTRCHSIVKDEIDLHILRQALSKCTYLQSLILDDIERHDAHDVEALMEAIVDTAPQLTSLSLENMSIIEDKHVQILLRGLPRLTSLNLSKCTGLTDDVFYLSRDQLSELKPIRDDSLHPGNKLTTVDLSGCQTMTNSCVRHLLELCGPNLRNLNVSCTGMDCTLLWYLSGYSLSSTAQLVVQSNKQQEEPGDELAVKELLDALNMLLNRLDEMKRDTMVDELEAASFAAGTHIHENVREDRESLGTSETGPEVQVDGDDKSSFGTRTSSKIAAAGSSCCPNLEVSSAGTGTAVTGNEQVGTSNAAVRSAVEECQDADAGISSLSSRAFPNCSSTTSTVTKDQQIAMSSTAARTETCLHSSAGTSCSSHFAFSTIGTAETRDNMEDLDAVVTSQTEALDVHEVNTEVLTSPIGGQSGSASDLEIARSIQRAVWSAGSNGQDNEGTRKDERTFDIEDVSLEIESGEKTEGSDGTLNRNDRVGYSEASVTQDPVESDAYTSSNSSISAELHTLDEETDKVHIKIDRNMNVEDPRAVSMHCQLCGHVKRGHRSGKMESANENLEPKDDSDETGTVPMQPHIQVCGASEVSAFSDQQEERCSSTNLNQGTALNSSFSGLNKDLSTVLGNECNLTYHNASSFSGCVDSRNSTSAPLLDSFAKRRRLSCADSEKKVLPDSVPMPSEMCHSESTAVCCAVEIENLQMHDDGVSNSGQTAHAALCCAVKTTDNSSSGEGSPSLCDEHTDMGNSSCSMPFISETIANDDTKASRSSEDMEGFDSMLPANVEMLPRLFEPNMISLDISFTALNHAVVASCLEDYFSVNQHMQKLVLSHNDLTNAMLEIISRNIKDLRYFSMYDAPEISNEGLASFLKGCPRLQHLDIQGLSHVGDQGIYPLFEHDDSRLSVVKLAETCITDITLNRIARTIGPKLQELVLLWCEDVTDAGLHKIALHCPSLKTLLLRQRTMLAETLQAFADNCPHLEDVGLSSVSCITGDLMESVAPRLKRLQTLDVSWNSDLTNKAVSVILSSCPVLSELLLCGVKQITDKPLLSIIANYSKWKRCQILIQLKMREQKLRRDTGMAQLSSDEEYEDLYVPHRSTSYAPSLSVLNLSFCDHVKDNHLQEIVAVCRGTLNIVDYYGEDITPKLLHAL